MLTQAGPGLVRRFGQRIAVIIPKPIAACVLLGVGGIVYRFKACTVEAGNLPKSTNKTDNMHMIILQISTQHPTC